MCEVYALRWPPPTTNTGNYPSSQAFLGQFRTGECVPTVLTDKIQSTKDEVQSVCLQFPDTRNFPYGHSAPVVVIGGHVAA